MGCPVPGEGPAASVPLVGAHGAWSPRNVVSPLPHSMMQPAITLILGDLRGASLWLLINYTLLVSSLYHKHREGKKLAGHTALAFEPKGPTLESIPLTRF